MADPLHSLPAVADRWDASRTERTLVGLYKKRRRRRVGVVIASLSVLLLAVWQLQRNPLQLALRDGSQVIMRDEDTRVVIRETSATSVALELEAGQARFEVTRAPQRVFRVRCGEVTVEVLGTSFEVERDGARTRVAVTRGTVAVSSSSGREELTAGEAGWFPRTRSNASVVDEASGVGLAGGAPAPELAEEDAPTTRSSGSSADQTEGMRANASTRSRKRSRPVAEAHAARTERGWREPAEQGEFERAYELLAKARVADDVEELMLAADTARLSGHPAAAVPFLKRVMSEHASDERASLAAFTLGGVLMQQLGQPRDAEAAYARARALSLNSSLAEDALARQVEAAHRAGDTAHARSLAREYVSQYPRGRRVRAVRRFGELDP